MSRNQDQTTTVVDTEVTLDAPVGRLRLLPTVLFGARAASLARVALPVAVLTADVIAGPVGAETMGTSEMVGCPANSLSW
jgi:hypothetical protein